MDDYRWNCPETGQSVNSSQCRYCDITCAHTSTGEYMSVRAGDKVRGYPSQYSDKELQTAQKSIPPKKSPQELTRKFLNHRKQHWR